MNGHGQLRVGAGLDDLGALDVQRPEVLECPYPYYARLRTSAPVFRTARGYWLVTGYDECCAVLTDTARFSGNLQRPPDPELDAILATGYPEVPTLLAADPPDHAHYRGLVNKAFLPTRVAQMEGQIETIADDLIDQFINDGRVDIVEQFAVGVPLTVIADALGVDRADLARFKRWSDDIVAPRSGLLTREELLAAAHSLVEFQHYMAERCLERRDDPRDDLLTDLVSARLDTGGRAGEPLTPNEAIGIIRQLLVAGNETTTTLIANVIALLIEQPSEMAAVLAEPPHLVAVIEESLRLDAPIQMLPKRAVEDVELGDEQIRAGDVLYVVYASANRDESRFACPAGFDADRANVRSHLAFGKGAHFCVGAALARNEARIAVSRLLARATDWAFDKCSELPLRRELSMQLRGPSHLDLVFRPIGSSILRKGSK